ncbi:MAG: phosphatidylserine synthase [Desulfuromonas sp.]|nr:MAG: phosphatidylserine synthase [Desulfuromonas sp.]
MTWETSVSTLRLPTIPHRWLFHSVSDHKMGSENMALQLENNCWRIAKANRTAFLIDGEDYFRAIAEACEAARSLIIIIGWDIDSRIRLRRGKDDKQETLKQFLDRLATEKPELQIYLLEWDFAMLYSMERETWPIFSLDWQTHQRVHFELDDAHPVGASHHQKIVTIDDKLAFVGGFDLACARWDTSEHLPHHPQRKDNGDSHDPFHDVQTLIDGDAAEAVAELARRRWRNLTGDDLPEVAASGQDPWPDAVPVDLKDENIAILRTEPEHEGESEVREIEDFYLSAIEQAKHQIYIENQYLTSHVIGNALEDSLSKKSGPEILIVLPKECSGWLEKETMGALRQRLLQRLRDADKHKRLKVFYPDHCDLEEGIINVHSKLMIVDGRLATIGSANLSNRSMGFDTECNLALTGDDDTATKQMVSSLRDRLLAEHLGCDPEKVKTTFEKCGSLLKTVESLAGGQRTLRDLPCIATDHVIDSLSADTLVDPERPLQIEQFLDYFGIGTETREEQGSIRQKLWYFLGTLAFCLLLAILWRLSPLGEMLTIDTLLNAADRIRESVFTVPIVLAIYLIGSCLMFPVTLMIVATAISFGPVMGFTLAFSGSLLGGLASYLAGRWLGRDVVRKLAGDRLNRLSRRLARRGWLTIALVRVVPIAPFTIINLVAGSTHISTRSFLIGTAVGMGPGIMAIMLFEGGIEQALRNPNWGTVLLAVAAIVGAVLLLYLGKRWLLKREKEI